MLYALAVIGIFVLVLAVRALLFRPADKPAAPAAEVTVYEERAVENFRDMIRCRTISYDEVSAQDEHEFEKFRALLDVRYPHIAAACEKRRVGLSGVIYHWKGKNAAKPWVLMAHYDVVPVDETMWQEAPFDAVLKDGEIWGRGTLDTKCTLHGVVEAAETLLENGFTPQNDLYLCFSGDEETFGESAAAMVRWFEAQGISPSVLDEGGAIVEGVFPGVALPAAAVGTGEKGISNVELSITGKGGHASTPPQHTPVGELAQAILAVENHPFQAELVPPVAALFDTLGRYAGFGMRLVFANLWCFRPLLFALAKKSGGELNAMVRTTCAFTKMEGGTAWNVIPSKVTAGANMRLLNQSPEQAAQEIRKKIGNDRVQGTVLAPNAPSPFSVTEGPEWDTLKETIRQTWPGVVVTPYLMVAASDSRHYARISDRVYRFCPMELPAESRQTIHGHNERIAVDALLKIVTFYIRFIQKL